MWQRLKPEGQTAIRLFRGGKLTSESARRLLAAHIVAEFCSAGMGRVSLESLGIAHVRYDRPGLSQVATAVAESVPELDKTTASSFAALALDLIRRDRAIRDPDESLDLTDDRIWGRQSQENRCFDLDKRSKRAAFPLRILPAERHDNRFSWVLERRLGLNRDQTFGALRAFFECAKRVRLLVRHGPGYGLDLGKVQVEDGRERTLYECQVCGTRTFRWIRSICPSWKCSGSLDEITAPGRHTLESHNHYASLYLENSNSGAALNAIAREHTAAIGTRSREELEEQFRAGDINLLSCTTTMELGVDLGGPRSDPVPQCPARHRELPTARGKGGKASTGSSGGSDGRS